MKLEIYIDGSYKPSLERGGWSYIILESNKIIQEDFNFLESTTSQRAELTSAIKAVDYCFNFHPESELTIYTDSKYLQLGMTNWIKNWIKNDWSTSAKTDVANKDLWEKLNFLLNHFVYEIEWVKGHSDNKWNNYCDVLAQMASEMNLE